MDELGVDDVLPNGKYKGELIILIISSDPNYLEYLVENAYLSLDDEAMAKLDEELHG